MTNYLQIFMTGFTFLVLMACEEVSAPNVSGEASNGWLIPKNEVFDGGPGKDGIPALSNPRFVTIDQVSYLGDDDLVVVAKRGSSVRVYPHKILDWHEIINDDFNGFKYAVSYCPLTGSALGYGAGLQVDGANETTTFGVSGLLYNSNLILYDRKTDSYWSQMLVQCVGGKLRGQQADFVQLLETRFGTVKTAYPQAMVVSNQTGVYGASRYRQYPYGDYRTNDDYLIFPVSIDDPRIDRKDRVLGIIGESARRAYQFKSFNGSSPVINDQLGGQAIVVAGNAASNYLLAFERRTVNGQPLTYQPAEKPLPAVFMDESGNVYDLFGEVIEGPESGSRLQPLKSFIAFWFSVGTFYPDIEIYD